MVFQPCETAIPLSFAIYGCMGFNTHTLNDTGELTALRHLYACKSAPNGLLSAFGGDTAGAFSVGLDEPLRFKTISSGSLAARHRRASQLRAFSQRRGARRCGCVLLGRTYGGGPK